MALKQVIDITSNQRETLASLLARHLPNTEAWVYGSRVRGTSRPGSDLDMVVLATPEQAREVSELREAFEESNLPFRVDLFVWDEVPESFREGIGREHVVLAEAKATGANRLPAARKEDLSSRRTAFLARTAELRSASEGRSQTPAERLIREDRDHGH